MPTKEPELKALKVRNVSVRLPEDIFETLVSVARVDGETMGEVIRKAINSHAADRKSSEDWAEKVHELQRQLKAVLPHV